MRETVIKTHKPYKYITCDSFAGLAEELVAVVKSDRLFVVYDKSTEKLFSKELREELCDFSVCEIVVPEGEKCKNFGSYKRLAEKLAENGADRTSALLAVGGGALSDLVGFVAATFMRGITYCVCPTTILSAIDASVGGKTAVNLDSGKNLVGAFYAPSLVYTNVSCFGFLPRREIESGMGEAVKYAFIDKRVSAGDIAGDIAGDVAGGAENLVMKCVEIKSGIVKKDEFETKPRGGRTVLNLGHTIGHALEASSGYSLSHGLCVAYGIKRIIDLSADFYGLNNEKIEEMNALLNVYPFDFSFDADMRDVKSRMLFDKKVSGSDIRLVLLKGAGEPAVEKVPISKVWKLLK